MNNEFILPSGLVAEEAEYKEQFIEEYNNNPFIQALPPIRPKEDIVKILNKKIKISEKELQEDDFIRIHLLKKIYKIFQPLPIHLKIWNMIDTLIRQGYVDRNPFNPQYKRHINMLGNNLINQNFSMNTMGSYATTTNSGLIIGLSGMGKSTSVNKVLVENIPQVICHNEYNGVNFDNVQVTWIKLEAPHNSSLKALTLQFFMKVDEILGTDNMKRYISKNLSVDSMLPMMGQCANNIGLGLLVVDELQHLYKNSKQVMNYFVALMNTFGVPILLIGTPACYDMLQQEMRIARRLTFGEIIWNNMKNDKEFRLFLNGIWKHQYVKKKTKLTEEIICVFYEKTQGISDLVVKLFIKVQEVAIERGDEEITINLLNKVWNKEFNLLKPIINTIKSNNKAKMFKYEDIRILDNNENIKVPQCTGNTNAKKTIKSEIVNKESRKKIKINELENNDIRKIVMLGAKENRNSYQSLLESGVIKNIETIIGVEQI